MSRNYKFHNPSGVYFVSFATVNWVDVFTRELYYGVLVEAINYCRKEKGMELFAYCFMPNHVHLLFRSVDENPSGLLRDFKRHTAKRTIEAIIENPKESKKEWMLSMFKEAGKKNVAVSTYQFWQHHNKPIEIWSNEVLKQKINYIHQNPVKEGFVTNAVDWKYSSARNFEGDETILKIDVVGFLDL